MVDLENDVTKGYACLLSQVVIYCLSDAPLKHGTRLGPPLQFVAVATCLCMRINDKYACLRVVISILVVYDASDVT